jgi:isoleucyl-tRNA synthetase
MVRPSMAKGSKKAPNKYERTMNLRESPLPARGDLARREPEILARWAQTELYQKILDARASAPAFILHDGPPYSNGNIHYGHILNKVLKDIVVKYKAMAGYRAPYVPGWDTHGLPIELAVERELAGRRDGMTQAEVRGECRRYALRFVDLQRDQFRRLGILGEWDHPYLTLEPTYERAIVRALAAFARGGWLYRGQKPVFWCPRDQTALAEAEIEYARKSSPSIFVRFPADVDPATLDPRLAGKRLALPIWTTTPWTLPANLAVVLGPHLEYVAVPHPRDPAEVLLVARPLAAAFVTAIGGTPDEAAWVEIDADALRRLEGVKYEHPFLPAGEDHHFRVWFADYVTTEAGTGLVHTAPGHGADDYRTGLAHDLPPYAPVDAAGRFTAEVPLWASMATVEANPKIVDHLAASGFLLNQAGEQIEHDYPHCWRCKGPILFRATPQWFLAIDHAGLRANALAEIDRTTWVPPWGRNRIYGMIETRPDWVLSRQRLWGVPIPTFYCKPCGAEQVSAELMEHVAEIFGRDGADAWWTRPIAELVPAGTRCAQCGAGADGFERERDIVDVWFESGVSWLAMRDHTPGDHTHDDIDLYLEGSDQHRGWFHSSLLASIGVQGKAPYRQVITHGFVVDKYGKEYSKTRIEKARAEGIDIEYIPPEDVIARGGAEMFRMWVASSEFRDDITWREEILDTMADWYRKYRGSLRFLLANLYDFDPDAEHEIVTHLDQMMLRRIDDVIARCRRAYDAYELTTVHRTIVQFVNGELSSFYCDVVKDRLYAEASGAVRRRSAQAVLYAALRALTLLTAPINCFTAEDVWERMPRRTGDPESVHMAILDGGVEWAADDPLRVEFERVLAWRDKVNLAMEPFRAAKHKSVDGKLVLRPRDAADTRALWQLLGELPEWFIVSGIDLAHAPADSDEPEVAVHEHGGKRCERCWKWFGSLAKQPDDVCERCAEVLTAIGAVS